MSAYPPKTTLGGASTQAFRGTLSSKCNKCEVDNYQAATSHIGSAPRLAEMSAWCAGFPSRHRAKNALTGVQSVSIDWTPFLASRCGVAGNLTNYALKGEKLNMHKLAITLVATMVLVFAGGLAWKADATTGVGDLTSLTKKYSPIEKVCVGYACRHVRRAVRRCARWNGGICVRYY
jgi:hypothetical protein